MARSSCRKVVLKSLKIDGYVRGKIRTSRGKERLATGGVDRRKNLWNEGILKWHWNIRQRSDQRLEDERKISSDIVLQPQIRENRGDRSAGMQSRVLAQRVIYGSARPPAI